MKLMIDRMLAGCSLGPARAEDIGQKSRAEYEAWLLPALRKAKVVVADNVATYFYDRAQTKEQWDIQKDFPTLTPPFPVTWIEMMAPEGASAPLSPEMQLEINSRLDPRLRMASPPIQKLGLLYTAIDAPDGGPEGIEVRWIIEIHVFCQIFGNPKNGLVIGPYARVMISLDKEGAVVPGSLFVHADTEEASVEARRYVTFILPALLTVSFFHCKNVKVIEKAPAKFISSNYERKYRRPMARYHVLEIEPMRKVLRKDGDSETTGLKQALHICRGHFKDYRQSGLFGKHKSIFWWDHTVKGSAKEGVVDKHYAMNSPREARDG